MTPSIAIIGAGEAGLTLARLLEVNNIDYVVFERSDSSDTAGFWGTLDIHPDTAQVVLREALLFDKFEAVARFDTQVTVMFDQHGEIIMKNDVDLPQIDWHDLRALLIQSIPTPKIRWNTEVREVIRDLDGVVSLHLGDDSIERGFRLVVGADGIWSRVRPLITNEVPRYYGITYLQTSISPESTFWSTVAGIMKPTNYMSIGQGKQIAAQKNVAGTYTVFLGLPLEECWTHANIDDAPGVRDKLLQTEFQQSHWSPRVLNWLRHADGEFVVRRLYTVSPESFSWEAVPGLTIVGDAAHPCTPWSAESMTHAMYGSFQLAKQIAHFGCDDLDRAVAEYEKQMFPRAVELITNSTDIHNVFFAKNAAEAIEALME